MSQPSGAAPSNANTLVGNVVGPLNAPRGRMGAKRDLHVVFILDRSGSMAGERIESLNFAMNAAITALRDEAPNHQDANIVVRALAFATGLRWVLGDSAPIGSLKWVDLDADGVTNMGDAMEEVTRTLQSLKGQKLYAPVLILVTDGEPTDNFDQGLQKLLSDPIGKQATRLAVAIGEGCRTETLEKFIAQPEIKPLRAHNAEEVARYIKLLTIAGTQGSIVSRSTTGGKGPLLLPMSLQQPTASPPGSGGNSTF